MIILFKEVDSFTKGDGKPFNAGENIYRGIETSLLCYCNIRLCLSFNEM